MSTEKPTTPKDGTTAVSTADHWRELEGRTGGAPDAEGELATTQLEPKDPEEKGRKRALSRRARTAIPAALIAFAVALAWIVVPALVGGDSARRSQPAPEVLPAKARKADKRRSSRARWVKEPDEGAQPRQRRTALGTPHVRRHTHPQHEPRRPDPPPPGAPSQPPASGTTPPEPASEPSAPAPPPPSEPKGNPGLRDGATESAEFGL
jgi:hypothetical protein